MTGFEGKGIIAGQMRPGQRVPFCSPRNRRRADRFPCGKQIASYLGLVPLEESSRQRRRLGHITKQGNSLLCFLLVEAAQVTVRSDPDWRRKDFHLAHGTQTRRSSVLDVAQGMGLGAVEKVRFARGTTWKSPWCAVEHRAIDWVSAPLLGGSSNQNHDRGA
jgi:hypothetical protein